MHIPVYQILPAAIRRCFATLSEIDGRLEKQETGFRNRNENGNRNRNRNRNRKRQRNRNSNVKGTDPRTGTSFTLNYFNSN